MDFALKQRLVGASVLVALAVIFIPMLLDGSGNQGSRRVPVDIPDTPRPRMQTRLLPLDPPPVEPDPSPTMVAPPPVTQSAPVSAPPAASSDRPQATPPVVTPAASAEEQLAVELVRPARAVSTGEWVLQLGSFSQQSNATRLVEQLKAEGWQAYQEPVVLADRTLYRVRAGYWASKNDAAEEGTRLSGAFPDIQASVTRLADAVTEAPPALAAGWMVQVGSFSEQDNAMALRQRLRGAGFTAHVEIADGRYRVRVGPTAQRPQAEAMREQLREQLALTGIVVSHP